MAQAQWTFFYYCNAESDLFDNVVTMVKNMGKLNFPPGNKVNILLLIDRIKIRDTMVVRRFYKDDEYKWHDALRFVVRAEIDAIRDHAESSIGDVDMGDPDVLKDFIKWGRKEFPAKHYGLVIYGHGSGISVGNMMEYTTREAQAANFLLSALIATSPVDSDDNTGRRLVANELVELFNETVAVNRGPQFLNMDRNEAVESFARIYLDVVETANEDQEAVRGPGFMVADDTEHSIFSKLSGDLEKNTFRGRNSDLYVYEIRQALQSIRFKPDLVLFDSCFMMTFETVLELKNSAHYLLGSQGFNSRAPMSKQSFLQHLLNNPGIPPRELAAYIVENIPDRLGIESPEAPTVSGQPGVSPQRPDFFRKLYSYSCIDLKTVGAFNKAFNVLITGLMNPDDEAIDELVNSTLLDIIPFYLVEKPDKFYIGTIDLLFFLEGLHQRGRNHSLLNAIQKCIRLLKKVIVMSSAGEEMTTSKRPAYNPKGLCIFFPSDSSLDIEGGTLMRSYWYAKSRKLLMLKEKSLWDDYILKRISGWYETHH